MSAARHLLVYADGRVEDSKHELMGNIFIIPEMKNDGSYWERHFSVSVAYRGDPEEDGTPYTMIGREVFYEQKRTAEEIQRMRSEMRQRHMDMLLTGLLGARS